MSNNGSPYRRPPPGGTPPDNMYRNDPFGDAPPAVYVQESMPPRRSPQPQPFESTVSLPRDPRDFVGQTATYHEQDYDEEKIPLTGGQGYAGGLYPPG